MFSNCKFNLLVRTCLRLSCTNKPYTTQKHVSESTIYALSSGFGKCGVAVIRISGPQSKEVLKTMAGFKNLPEARVANLRKLRNPLTKEVLDNGIVLWFPGPRSFTGEDCCELQVHGGQAVISAVLRSLSLLDKFRPALPGEFTRRAFFAGKLDLTEVEGLADLIQSETEAQRKQALSQMEGSLSKVYKSWANTLTKCVAHIEAYIDFSEEENLDESVFEQVNSQITHLSQLVKNHLHDGYKGERLREGVNAVIIGAPNAGKSSLLNILSRCDSAIVSPLAGTTRDIIKSTLDIGGFPVTVHDTAGLRSHHLSLDPVEREGISRAVEAADKAHLVLLVVDASSLPQDMNKNDFLLRHVESLGVSHLASLWENFKTIKRKFDCEKVFNINNRQACLIVYNKMDLLAKGICKETSEFEFGISCKTEEGIDRLVKSLTSVLETLCGRPGLDNPSWSQARHRYNLELLLKNLNAFLKEQEPDIMAHYLRQALYHIGTITGHVSTDHILDVIFKDFCIGK